ncbi:MAG: hypothetical protein FWC47_08655 [Oscillospiraceae bacterium]|nr:hypothetical protein [Oscillospiraceae bacterium]
MTWNVKYTSEAEQDLEDIYNYLIFYIPNESQNAISIVNIIYSGRNIEKQFHY